MRRTFAFLALAGLAAAMCSSKTCAELGYQTTNYHYDYSHVCAEPKVDGRCSMPSMGSGKTYAQAAAMCAAEGARLCSMTELLYNAAKGTGCDVEQNRVWTLTSCAGGHVTQGGAFIESRQDGLGLECSAGATLAGVVCCSTDKPAEHCVEETATACSAAEGTHSCCEDRKYTYNPVPCESLEDCMTCVEPAAGRHDCEIEPYRYMKKVDIETSIEGFVCCNMEDEWAQCENGYCKHAPCKGDSKLEDTHANPEEDSWWFPFTEREWSNVRGDEWSRMACFACHGNGCDQCELGYFKYDHHSECIQCEAMDNCAFCQDHNACAQCADGRQRAECPPLPGILTKSYCCDSPNPTMCQATITKTPNPNAPPTPTTPVATPTPATYTPAPASTTPMPNAYTPLPVSTPTPNPPYTPEDGNGWTPLTPAPTPAPYTPEEGNGWPKCAQKIGLWGACAQAPGCCAQGSCYKMNQYYAQCRESCTEAAWDCTVFTPPSPPAPPTPAAPVCAAELELGAECLEAPDCCVGNAKCYAADEEYAVCSNSCQGEPWSEGWSCAILTAAPTPAAPPTPTTACTSSTISAWGTCTYQPNCCATGLTCFERNMYYSQCRPGCDPQSQPGWSCKVRSA